MGKMIHTSCGGLMKKHKNGLKCSKCGYKLKHKEINNAYMKGKIDLRIPEGPAETSIKGRV